MVDQVLSWLLIVLPVVFGFVLILVPAKHEDQKQHMRWRYILAVLSILFGALTWLQQSRAAKASSKEREDAIERTAAETSAKVTKAVGDEYQAMITDLTSQIQSLKQQLSLQAKDVGIIKGSDIVTGKAPIKVEVTNQLPTGATAPTTRDASELANRRSIRVALGHLESAGQDIKEKCLGMKTSPFPCEDEANKWYNQAIGYIKTNLEPSYLDRFESATGIWLNYNGAAGDEKTNGVANQLTFKVAKLEEFIKEYLN